MAPILLSGCQSAGDTARGVWAHLTTREKTEGLAAAREAEIEADIREFHSGRFGPSSDSMIRAGIWAEASRYEFGPTEAAWQKDTFSATPSHDGFDVVPEKEAENLRWRFVHAERFFTTDSPDRPVRTVYFSPSRDFTKAKILAVEDVRYRRDGSVEQRWIRHFYPGGGIKSMFHYRSGRLVTGMSRSRTGRYSHLAENGEGELGFYEDSMLGETLARKDVYASGVRLFSGLYQRGKLAEVKLTTPKGSFTSGGGTETLYLEKTGESWTVGGRGAARYHSPDQSLTNLPEGDGFYRAAMKLQRRINAFQGERSEFLSDYRQRLTSSGKSVGDLGIGELFGNEG